MHVIEQHGIDSKQAVKAVREIIRRAILTFNAEPNPLMRLGLGSPSYNRQYKGDYPDEVTRVRFQPTRYDIDQAIAVLPWLKWLRDIRGADGPLAVRRIIRWCHGVQSTDQGRREGVSANSIMSRIDRDIAAIIGHFFSLSCTVQVVEEPFKKVPFAAEWSEERARAFGLKAPMIMTVYVHTGAYMRNGKVWDKGERQVEKMFHRLKKTG